MVLGNERYSRLKRKLDENFPHSVVARFCPIAGGCRGAAAAAMESDGINRVSDWDVWANGMRFVRLRLRRCHRRREGGKYHQTD